jgi:hypothetical protein
MASISDGDRKLCHIVRGGSEETISTRGVNVGSADKMASVMCRAISSAVRSQLQKKGDVKRAWSSETKASLDGDEDKGTVGYIFLKAS